MPNCFLTIFSLDVSHLRLLANTRNEANYLYRNLVTVIECLEPDIY